MAEITLLKNGGSGYTHIHMHVCKMSEIGKHMPKNLQGSFSSEKGILLLSQQEAVRTDDEHGQMKQEGYY